VSSTHHQAACGPKERHVRRWQETRTQLQFWKKVNDGVDLEEKQNNGRTLQSQVHANLEKIFVAVVLRCRPPDAGPKRVVDDGNAVFRSSDTRDRAKDFVGSSLGTILTTKYNRRSEVRLFVACTKDQIAHATKAHRLFLTG
jgi:hypothetical protein